PPSGGTLEWTTDPDNVPWTVYDNLSIIIDQDGETTIYARTINGVGAVSEVRTAVIQIDRGTPVIQTSMTTLGEGHEYVEGSWTNQDVEISVRFENEHSPLMYQEVNINGQIYFEEPVVLTNEGKHTLNLMAFNEVGGMTMEGPLN